MERRWVFEIAHLDLRLRLERREIGEVVGGDAPTSGGPAAPRDPLAPRLVRRRRSSGARVRSEGSPRNSVIMKPPRGHRSETTLEGREPQGRRGHGQRGREGGHPQGESDHRRVR